MKNKILIFAIIALAIILRLLYFRSVTFFYDQARDAFAAVEIFHGDPIKIHGPMTDIPGLYHGPLYWYLLAPVYDLSHGNVLAARMFLVIINLFGLYFIYDLTSQLFKNKKISIIAGFLYAISFEAIAYSRWLSNPTPALLTTTISFWSLYKLLHGKKWAIITLLISWGISIQVQMFMLYQIIPFIAIWLFTTGGQFPKTTKKFNLIALGGFLALMASYILSELKFNFQGLKAFFLFLKTQNLFGGSFINLFNQYLDRLSNLFFLNLWGVNLFFAGLTALATLYFCYRQITAGDHKKEFLFLTIWLLSPIVVNFFTGPNANFLNIGALVPAIIITAYMISLLEKKWKVLAVLALLIIFGGNLNLIFSKNPEGDVLFTVQKQMILKDELKIIDWIYGEAGGKPFKLNTFTQPLFINSTWAFLFNWYGQSKYGYMPIWWGEKQVDVPGANIKFADNNSAEFEFFIIEPGATGDDNFVKAVRVLENGRSEIVKSERIGYFTVEKRKITNEFTFTSGDVFRVIKGTDLRELQKVQ